MYFLIYRFIGRSGEPCSTWHPMPFDSLQDAKDHRICMMNDYGGDNTPRIEIRLAATIDDE